MLAPNGGINHKLPSSKELRYASTEMHKNAPKAEIILFFKSSLLSLNVLEQRFTRPCNSPREFFFLLSPDSVCPYQYIEDINFLLILSETARK